MTIFNIGNIYCSIVWEKLPECHSSLCFQFCMGFSREPLIVIKIHLSFAASSIFLQLWPFPFWLRVHIKHNDFRTHTFALWNDRSASLLCVNRWHLTWGVTQNILGRWTVEGGNVTLNCMWSNTEQYKQRKMKVFIWFIWLIRHLIILPWRWRGQSFTVLFSKVSTHHPRDFYIYIC